MEIPLLGMPKKITNFSSALSSVAVLVISILIAQTAGAIGSIFTAKSIPTWYAGIEKPFFSPPNWLFGPVWVALYALMGIAAYLVWQKRQTAGAKQGLWLYLVHLAANALWSVIFFGLQNPGLAFVEILILWALILAVIWRFYKIRKTAGLILIPYIAWVTFAAFLNFAIWQLNL